MKLNQRRPIDHPPRIQPELPGGEYEIPGPPDTQESSYGRLLQIALPLFTIVGYIFLAVFGGVGRNPLFLLPMALSVVASMGFSLYSYRKDQQRRAGLEKQYAEQLIDLNQQMREYHEQQRRFYFYNYPDAQTKLVLDVHLAPPKSEHDDHEVESVAPADEVQVRVQQASNRVRARLWERRVGDEDFGALRIGIGTVPSTVVYKLGQVGDPSNPQVREALKLVEDSHFLTNTPVLLSLRRPAAQSAADDTERDLGGDTPRRRFNVAHAIGIVGEQEAVYASANSLIADFVIFHPYDNARLYIVAPTQVRWQWANDLPHCQSNDQSAQTLFVRDDSVDAKTGSEDDEYASAVDRFLEAIRKTLAQRQLRLRHQEQGEESQAPDLSLPFLLAIVDLLDIPNDVLDKMNAIVADGAISMLLDQGHILGAAIIFLISGDRSRVPSRCQVVIEVEKVKFADVEPEDQAEQLRFRYAEVGLNTPRYIGTADAVSTLAMRGLAAKLKCWELKEEANAQVPAAVPFLAFAGADSLQALIDEVPRHWQASTLGRNARPLRAKIGVLPGAKHRSLVFSSKADGNHALVAGSTGSGKSELLISLILSMAIQYDPTLLNFVLVDFKGGTAFKPFEKLPHCVEVVTNLTGDRVARMFLAIRSVIDRRNQLNERTKTKDIVDYRRREWHIKTPDGSEPVPYPYLFIVIDEFAEVIAAHPEYKAQLDSITRLGRSVGVSLILAAQRPSGVTDQMRANIKLRICLRVETPVESRELLRRSEAAFLPANIPGRGYIQVGNDEIELIQIAYAGDKYLDPAKPPPAVIWSDDIKRSDDPDGNNAELYRLIIEKLDETASGRPTQRAPWPDFLPPTEKCRYFSLQTVLMAEDPATHQEYAITDATYLEDISPILLGRSFGRLPAEVQILTLCPSLDAWFDGSGDRGPWLAPKWRQDGITPVIGLVDNPYAGKQLPFRLTLRDGHVAIFGASGAGKTTLLRTAVVSLVATYMPNHVHLYMLDLSGRGLGMFDGFTYHVGAIIRPDEEGYRERVEQLLRELQRMIDERKQVLGNHAADIYEHNEAKPSDPLPVIIVMIDNFAEFVATFGEAPDNVPSILAQFVELAQQSRAYGIHFVITIDSLAALPNQLTNLFPNRVALRLVDPMDYRVLVGATLNEAYDIPGRGYIRIEGVPLSFQTALPFGPKRVAQAAAAGSVTFEQLTRMEKVGIATLSDKIHNYVVKATNDKTLTLTELVRIGALATEVDYQELLFEMEKPTPSSDLKARLQNKIRQNWEESREPNGEWPEVMLGRQSGNERCQIRFEANCDGVHGMIAGGTGSGKSELLRTLIIDIAIRYDPSAVNFVLIDFKGGGAFDAVRCLPHCVDYATNLSKAGISRLFTSILAEMEKREQFNARNSGVDTIADYRKLRPEQRQETREYPHLFIVIDEYSELSARYPELREILETITKRGRSSGMHLIVASQKLTKKEITDQMLDNVRLRICLRVEEPETSKELLRRADAARLPSSIAGRGYLKSAGFGIRLLQVARVSKPLSDSQESGVRALFLDYVIEVAKELYADKRSFTPWPYPLPKSLALFDDTAGFDARYLGAEDRELIAGDPKANPPQLHSMLGEWLHERKEWPLQDWRGQPLCAVIGIGDDLRNGQHLALTADLSLGHLAVLGAPLSGKTTFLRTLIVSMAATYSPREFHAHIVDMRGGSFESLRTLRHVGTIISADDARLDERVQLLLRKLENLISERRQKFTSSDRVYTSLREYNENNNPVLPGILVVIDGLLEFVEEVGGIRSSDDMTTLYGWLVSLARGSAAFGVYFGFSANGPRELPKEIANLAAQRYALALASQDDYTTFLGRRVVELDDIPGRGYFTRNGNVIEFQTAVSFARYKETGGVRVFDGEDVQRIRTFAKSVEGVRMDWEEPLRIDALPFPYSYLDIAAQEFNIAKDASYLSNLKERIAQSWKYHDQAEAADWLSVILGARPGAPRQPITFSADKDGVHGVVAGGTGSGKSDLLMTMVVGLAMRYSPRILNFVFVDFKGGGAFGPFTTLPHCVDLVTNLDMASVIRMFTAIDAEMDRRTMLNGKSYPDIVAYRASKQHNRDEAPYPHLFLIIDEYAELMSEDNLNTVIGATLKRIARIGRSLGVHMVLAAQEPVVPPQMSANIALRLCLRVQDGGSSENILGRPDGATLPRDVPGRGYLQTGNKSIEMIQVGFSRDKLQTLYRHPVVWRNGHKDLASALEAVQAEETPRFHDTVVHTAQEIWRGKVVLRPWPGFLPKVLSLESSCLNSKTNAIFQLAPQVSDWINGDTEELWPGIDWGTAAMRPIVGLLDMPTKAEQIPLQIDMRKHMAVFGTSGSGKSTFLQTVIVSLAATHSPQELQIYVVDRGGRKLKTLEGLPHIRAIIYSDEEDYQERFARLVERLQQIKKARGRHFAGTNGFYRQERAGGVRQEPAILVVIDNIADLTGDTSSILETLIIPLMRSASPLGISFLLSNYNTSPSKLHAVVDQVISFRQTNSNDYDTLLAMAAKVEDFGEIPGRGVLKRNGQRLYLQAALPCGLQWGNAAVQAAAKRDELAPLARYMQLHPKAQELKIDKIDKIDTLQAQVSLHDCFGLARLNARQVVRAIVGQQYDHQAAEIDFHNEGPHFVVIGPPRSGKSYCLRNICLSLAYSYTPEKVTLNVVDLKGKLAAYGGRQSLDGLPHLRQPTITDLSGFIRLMASLKEEYAATSPSDAVGANFLLIDNYDFLREEVALSRDSAGKDTGGANALTELALLLRNFGQQGLHVVLATATAPSSDDVWRRVMSSGYGLGLQSESLLTSPLAVTKVPALFRAQENPPGRGCIVKSGQPTLVQIALPHAAAELGSLDELVLQQNEPAAALDQWVREIQKQYQAAPKSH